MNNAEDVTITNNTSEKDASFVHYTGSTNVVFSHNWGEDFAALTATTTRQAVARRTRATIGSTTPAI